MLKRNLQGVLMYINNYAVQPLGYCTKQVCYPYPWYNLTKSSSNALLLCIAEVLNIAVLHVVYVIKSAATSKIQLTMKQ